MILSDSSAVNSTFTALRTLMSMKLTFELAVTNDDGLVRQPDSIAITVGIFNEVSGQDNNIKIQVQENSGNNVVGQFGD